MGNRNMCLHLLTAVHVMLCRNCYMYPVFISSFSIQTTCPDADTFYQMNETLDKHTCNYATVYLFKFLETQEELWKFGWMIIRSFTMQLCHMLRTHPMESELNIFRGV